MIYTYDYTHNRYYIYGYIHNALVHMYIHILIMPETLMYIYVYI